MADSSYKPLSIMSRDSDDQDALLDDNTDSIDTPLRHRDTLWRSRFPKYMLLFQTFLLMLNISLIFWSITGRKKCEPQVCQAVEAGAPTCEPFPFAVSLTGSGSADPQAAPALLRIEHLWHDMDHGENSATYFGDPSPALDDAWAHLMKSAMVKISAQELQELNSTSVALRDGSGYLAYLETSHMLHCVKRMHQYMHRDHYPDVERKNEFSSMHMNHCFELLRTSIMCNTPGARIATYKWGGANGLMANEMAPRKCLDWDALEAWVDERAIEVADWDWFLTTLEPPVVNG